MSSRPEATVALRFTVAHVIDELPPHGAERLLADLMRVRNPGDFRYIVVCLDAAGALSTEIEAAGVPVFVVGRRWKVDPWAFVNLIRLLKRERVDIVHTHLFTADSYGRLASLISRSTAAFSTVHTSIAVSGVWRRLLNRVLARMTFRVLACSEGVAETLVGRDRIPSTRVSVVPNGVDVSRFSCISRQRIAELSRIPTDHVLIGLVGRLHPSKGHEDCLKALALLRDRGLSKFHCLLIGDGELGPSLRSMASELRIEQFVTFMGVRNDVPDLLCMLDIVVVPSRWEGLPMAMLEAMAAGRPLIAARVGGIPDVIQHMSNGLLIEAAMPQQLADSLAALLTDDALRRRLGCSARETVDERYSVKHTLLQYESLYRMALR